MIKITIISRNLNKSIARRETRGKQQQQRRQQPCQYAEHCRGSLECCLSRLSSVCVVLENDVLKLYNRVVTADKKWLPCVRISEDCQCKKYCNQECVVCDLL